jgi:triacylglycerol esterase/lipase EstA (alpha/beta hydrolase family)
VLASLLRLSLGIELVFYGLGSVVIAYYSYLQPYTVFALALGTGLGIRILLVIVLFVLAWRYRSKRPPKMRIGPLRSIVLFFSELLVFLLLYGVFQPFERWWMPRPSARSTSNQLPVLLIHGYSCNAAVWWAMQRYLRRYGIDNLFTLNLEPVFGNIDQYAQQVAERVTQISMLYGGEQVILVGHSMGGLVARNYIHSYGGKQRVAKLITLGSPHRGTAHARFAFVESVSVQQMRPGSLWLTQLNAAETEPSPVPMVSIYSYHDDLIAPQESSALPYEHVKNVPLAGIGHLQMMFSKRFGVEVLQAIQETSLNPISSKQNYRRSSSEL